MIRDKSSKELFEYIRTVDTSNLPPLKSILSEFNLTKISCSDVLVKLKTEPENILLIDARSESEFAESAISNSINFPVLNNFERHNVGLIYKKYSQSAALWLAMQYANPKLNSLRDFLQENKASEKSVIVYCWRGGGRSGYLSKMIHQLGFDPIAVTGGEKSFRGIVNDFFRHKTFPYRLKELSGLTGSGKTELLRTVSSELPVIDLEKSARHYSSLLGHIPYHIRNVTPVSNQSAFENDIYLQIHLNKQIDVHNSFVIESESKRVGDFEIPEILFAALQDAPSIELVCSVENRVQRIVKDYFEDDLRGLVHVFEKMREKEKFFKQQLSTKIYDMLISLLEKGKVHEFTEVMLKEYYDKRYKRKNKKPVARINSDDITSAAEEIIHTLKT